MAGLSKSTKPIKRKEVKRGWHIVDLKGKILGRAVSQITSFLQGKHKVYYTPYLDVGDYVVVVNARYVKLSGRKEENKVYTRYSGYPGGLKKITFRELIDKDPSKVIRYAVKGMLPKNKLRDKRLGRLFVYPDENHPYKDKFKKVKN